MKLRVVSYAINGRGMGHLVRQLAILRQVRRVCALLDVKLELWVLTSSEADTLARREGICALKMPSKAMVRDAGMEPARFLRVARTWVLNAIAGLQPDLLIVDTFPSGSFGELIAALELARHRALVARRVKPQFALDPAYNALLPLYQQQIVPDDSGVGAVLIRSREELTPREEARQALGIPKGQRAVYVSLGGGGDRAASTLLPRLVKQLRGHWHVVVGAGPLYMGPELRGEGITWLSRYVPMQLFNGLDAAVSAGGYNSFHELMHAGVPTVFLPQSRIADDQLERVKRAVAAGAGRLAEGPHQVLELLEDPGSAAAARALVPTNNALKAALQCLRGVLPQEELDWAAAAMPPRLEDGDLQVIRLLGGIRPAQPRSFEVGPDQVSERLRRWRRVCGEHSVPAGPGWHLLQALHRKFPGANPDALLAAVEQLFAVWAGFDDWMGAISLLRALPTQRGYDIEDFAAAMVSWLRAEEDLFDALRDFTRLEGNGAQAVSVVLGQLVERRG